MSIPFAIASVSVRIGALAAMLTAVTAPAFAQGSDPHNLYENTCGRCHAAHAGDFVREDTITTGGAIAGRRTGEAVAGLLSRGHGRVTPDEAAALTELFERIARSDALFMQKCRICHDRGAAFARRNIVETNDGLAGRYSGRDIAGFLTYHGRLSPAEAETILSMFRFQLRTATRR